MSSVTTNTSIASSINFLKAIGHTDRVYIRCLTPKLTPVSELQERGMTYTDSKTSEIKKSTIDGYLVLDSGEFCQKYGSKYKPIADGWGQLEAWNKQGYGIYFTVHHGGYKNSEITHGSALFHEFDRLTIEEQQQVIACISGEFGKPTAVVKTRKSLHAYWSSSETIPIESLASYQRRWMQYSNCDDLSLSDPAQLMRLPEFDHVSWNPELGDFDRVSCELLLNDVHYSLEQFDRILPELDRNQWSDRSLKAIPSDETDTDMRTLAQYLDGYTPNGREGWDTAKCPAHDGESSDSLHINRVTGGFICHGGCNTSAAYNATKARAVAAGHRFEVETPDDVVNLHELKTAIDRKLTTIDSDYPLHQLFPESIAAPLFEYHQRTAVPQGLLAMALITCLATLFPPESYLECFGGTDRRVKAIFWFCVYGLSGNGKSHSYDPVLKILRDFGAAANAVYADAKKEYEALQRKVKRAKPGELSDDLLDEADRPKPDRERYVVDSTTIEALMTRSAKQPQRGLLMYADELVGWCHRMEIGKGEVEMWLSLKSGKPVDGERQTREFEYVAAPSISVMGGMQPDVMRKMMLKQEEIQNGFLPRLTLVRYNETPAQPINNVVSPNYTPIKTLFEALRNDGESRVTYLDPACLGLAQQWQAETDGQRLKESRKSIKPIYPKFNELGYQIAFMLHTINRKLDPTLQEQIPRHTFETAIGFARWLLNQSISIHEELLEAEENDSFVAHFIKSSEHKGWMNARKIGRAYGKKRFKDTDAVREFMTKLIKMDLVDSKGTGAKLEISCHYQTPITVDRLTKLSKRIVDTDFQVSTEVVDKVDKISSDACTSEVAASTELVDKIRDGQQHDVQASSNDGRVNDTKYQRDDMSIDGDGNPILSTNNEIATTHIPIESHDILSILSTEAVDTLNLYSESVSNSFVNLSTENSKTDGQVPTKQDDPDPENGLPSGDAMESVKHPDEMERLQTLVIENDVVMEF